MNYPIWAHAEYETEYDSIRELISSLSPGDVVQINDRKEPLRIHRITDDGSLESDDPDPVNDTTYLIKNGDGQKYGTYFHRGSSKTGIGQIAVIYRDNGSISQYTESDLKEILDGESGSGLFEVTYESPSKNIRPIRTGIRRKPRVRSNRVAEGEEAIERATEDLKAMSKNPERRAIARYQRGESVEDVDGLTQDIDFETRTEQAEFIALPENFVSGTPPGTLFFREPDVDGDRRIVIPLDTLESLNVIRINQG